MALKIEEQETHINFMRGDERAEIYTSDTTMMTKFDKLVKTASTEWKLKRECRISSGELIGKIYTCPVSFVSYRSKHINRNYTDEQRREIADRLHESTRDSNFSV